MAANPAVAVQLFVSGVGVTDFPAAHPSPPGSQVVLRVQFVEVNGQWLAEVFDGCSAVLCGSVWRKPAAALADYLRASV